MRQDKDRHHQKGEYKQEHNGKSAFGGGLHQEWDTD